VIPGARLEDITNFADKEVNTLGKSGRVIVMGANNDLSKDKVNMEFQVRHTRCVV
jgi:hypothetical protein